MSTPDDNGYDEPKARCVRETDKALLIYRWGGDGAEYEVWIPKSVIHDDSEVYGEDHFGTLVVEMWFARKQGWI